MADRALPQDRERFFSDGVDVLCRTAGHRPKSLKMGAAVEHFKNTSLKLLTSDKGGECVVLPQDLYAAKAREAVAKNFKVVKPGFLNKVKLRAKKLCSEMDLSVLAKMNARVTAPSYPGEERGVTGFHVGVGASAKLDVVATASGTLGVEAQRASVGRSPHVGLPGCAGRLAGVLDLVVVASGRRDD
ncbi:hypothetical protein HPB47_018415 [Ixodes persulcatus]|uniref:Uncharacterized protein n=1 Tax=Ixodes persulcatus TaxID=34615 RepID=A0AC60QN24_IXOPE|nr:hypothetical protein HPB47_018415 [Ixodes persulcatus]